MQGIDVVRLGLLAATTAPSGASLVGTVSKTNLGSTTTVETSLAALGTAAILTSDTDGTMAANSATRAPVQSAVVTYVAAQIATAGAGYQPLDATLTALAAANWAANAIPIGSGSNTLSQVTFAANTFPARASSGNLVAKDITDFGLSLVDDADAAAGRTTLGLGTAAVLDVGTGANNIPQRSSAGKILVNTSYSPFTTATPAASVTFNWNTTNDHALTMDQDTTLAFSNSTTGQWITAAIGQNVTGGWVITWPAGITWVGGVTPVVPTTASGVAYYRFRCTGTDTYHGLFDRFEASQPLDATLTAFAALTIAANSLTIGTGADAFSQTTFAANTFPARASTGSLVAKDISDAALTVLDDLSVAGMVNTLGGASSTGSGGLVRATSPTLVTPALGMPSSGDLGNCTNFSVTNISDLGAGVFNWLDTPSFTNLNSALTGDSAAGLSATQTLTNKRITRRVVSAADATSITANGDTSDVVYQPNTQAVGTLTMNAPTGTPTDGQRLTFRIKSTNVQTYSWNAIFIASVGTALPTASTGGTSTDNVLFEYDSGLTKWVCLATA